MIGATTGSMRSTFGAAGPGSSSSLEPRIQAGEFPPRGLSLMTPRLLKNAVDTIQTRKQIRAARREVDPMISVTQRPARPSISPVLALTSGLLPSGQSQPGSKGEVLRPIKDLLMDFAVGDSGLSVSLSDKRYDSKPVTLWKQVPNPLIHTPSETEAYETSDEDLDEKVIEALSATTQPPLMKADEKHERDASRETLDNPAGEQHGVVEDDLHRVWSPIASDWYQDLELNKNYRSLRRHPQETFDWTFEEHESFPHDSTDFELPELVPSSDSDVDAILSRLKPTGLADKRRAELDLWVRSNSQLTRVAVISSIVVVVGFLIGFCFWFKTA